MSTDRQRNAGIDRMLQATLRGGAGKTPLPCPDAELLAAFVEQRLVGHELATVEQHLAGCSVCQQSLAVLAHDDVPAAVAPVAAANRRPRVWIWRWLAPLGAVAGAVVLYVALSPDALAPPAALPPPSQVMTQRSDMPSEFKGGGVEGETSAREKGPAAPLPPGRRDAGTRPPAAPSPRPEAAAVSGSNVPEVPPPAPVIAPRDETPSPEKRVAAAGEPAAFGAQAVTPGQGARAQVVAAVKAEPVAVEPQAVAAARVVSAPDGATVWLLGQSGAVAKSTDGGRTWEPQVTGAKSDLVAGHALSASVCWLIGKAGIVLLTTDGERWFARPLPEAADLMAVRAVDGLIAMVTASDSRTFRTTDGGATWHAVKVAVLGAVQAGDFVRVR